MRKTRYSLQGWFLLFSLYSGYRFYHFVLHFLYPGRSFVERPSSIDAFLPIAGLISFKNFLLRDVVEPFHPAALVMFAAIVLVSLLMKKGFCGWICPVGTVSQLLWMTGEKVFSKGRRIPAWIDLPLRSLKYLIMGFFLFFIIRMSEGQIAAFFTSDYYKVADVKTMTFFTSMSERTLIVLLSLGGLSLIYRNFWCRYLCPYGALLGLLSVLSPFKISRSETKCLHCRQCSMSCPSFIDVEKEKVVSSPECFGCLTCVSRCPSKGALDVTALSQSGRKAIPAFIYPILLLVLFYIAIGSGILSGNWASPVPYEEYRRILSSAPGLPGHPGAE